MAKTLKSKAQHEQYKQKQAKIRRESAREREKEARDQMLREKFGLSPETKIYCIERGHSHHLRYITYGTVAIITKSGSKLICVVRFLNRRPNDPRGPHTSPPPNTDPDPPSRRSPSPNMKSSAASPELSKPSAQSSKSSPKPSECSPNLSESSPNSESSPKSSEPSPNLSESSPKLSDPSCNSGNKPSGTKRKYDSIDDEDLKIIQMWHDYHLCIRILYILATNRGKIHQNGAMKKLGELMQGLMWGIGMRSAKSAGRYQRGKKLGM